MGRLCDWAADAGTRVEPTVAIQRELLGPPVPRPRQVLAIGLNYAEHAAESNMTGSTVPLTFTKFPTCLTGPYAVWHRAVCGERHARALRVK